MCGPHNAQRATLTQQSTAIVKHLSNSGNFGELGFIRYMMDNSVDRIVRTFEAIPDASLYKKPHPSLSAPAWVFGHVVVKERDHIGGFAQNTWDLPEKYGILRGYGEEPSENELRQVVGTRDEIIALWSKVHQQTTDYMDTLTAEDLAKPPTHASDDDSDPIREFFSMTIHHQNYHYGELVQLAEMITGATLN